MSTHRHIPVLFIFLMFFSITSSFAEGLQTPDLTKRLEFFRCNMFPLGSPVQRRCEKFLRSFGRFGAVWWGVEIGLCALDYMGCLNEANEFYYQCIEEQGEFYGQEKARQREHGSTLGGCNYQHMRCVDDCNAQEEDNNRFLNCIEQKCDPKLAECRARLREPLGSMVGGLQYPTLGGIDFLICDELVAEDTNACERDYWLCVIPSPI